MTEKPRNPLSNDFKVACEIYKAETLNEKIWFTKLVSKLEGKVSKNTIANSLDTLADWGIIRGEYGPTENGHAGRLLQISNEHKSRIKDLYETYWKD